MLTIFLNGEATQTEATNLQILVSSLGLENKRFAVEQNERIVSKSKLALTTLQNNDRIEIIQAVGGG